MNGWTHCTYTTLVRTHLRGDDPGLQQLQAARHAPRLVLLLAAALPAARCRHAVGRVDAVWFWGWGCDVWMGEIENTLYVLAHMGDSDSDSDVCTHYL